ncbi:MULTISPECIES: hypothetical protein [Streptomyces]|uniref:Lipoprotein n=1 Tax=Streptomyces stelliscabiei TaxID=146820 RepID=A0A8I0PF42_9ACTN|nr:MULTISPECIES: hypothetical protein [Streptomyces]KND39706.1 hypothetical protein IQ64_37005 [Streptomyces stelliscabiei]MBE1603012.1 hypothetical protein [Streptomyces stelliscabiei]MDX2521669.1 hypothetical protein [Streptomyces stelliscabiei]MDX2557575.1 hypothetical protein [Streptomyces stelliscabiei]MDX2617172.1 hypothetical protein [Streptomyces stelliscabiei]
MKSRQIVVTAVTATVFAWSIVLVAAGQTAAVAALAPALALTVQQIVHASRSHTAPGTGNRVDAATDKEDDAP